MPDNENLATQGEFDSFPATKPKLVYGEVHRLLRYAETYNAYLAYKLDELDFLQVFPGEVQLTEAINYYNDHKDPEDPTWTLILPPQLAADQYYSPDVDAPDYDIEATQGEKAELSRRLTIICNWIGFVYRFYLQFRSLKTLNWRGAGRKPQ